MSVEQETCVRCGAYGVLAGHYCQSLETEDLTHAKLVFDVQMLMAGEAQPTSSFAPCGDHAGQCGHPDCDREIGL